ncbi:hypothetical protein CC80DRAFT_29776 [Byssothecium circinans]|uniref:Uncharacterized protein n=1 Tax=Byssothecium circinans TaxID=147558 RepID=A0A6A5TZQ4_9PLEO|nr:hypothetical protein CC80DRAFT_29776 [Byssothecium circinans]
MSASSPTRRQAPQWRTTPLASGRTAADTINALPAHQEIKDMLEVFETRTPSPTSTAPHPPIAASQNAAAAHSSSPGSSANVVAGSAQPTARSSYTNATVSYTYVPVMSPPIVSSRVTTVTAADSWYGQQSRAPSSLTFGSIGGSPAPVNAAPQPLPLPKPILSGGKPDTLPARPRLVFGSASDSTEANASATPDFIFDNNFLAHPQARPTPPAQSRSPTIVSTLTPPRVPNAAESSHSHAESVAAKTDKEKQTEFKEQFEKNPKAERVKGKAEKGPRGKQEWVKFPISTAVIFNTPLPNTAPSRSGGRGGTRGGAQNGGRADRSGADKDGAEERVAKAKGEAEAEAKAKAEAEAKATEEEKAAKEKAADEAAAKAGEDAGGPEAFDTPSSARKHIKHNAFLAESSRDDNSSTFRSSSALATESTAPTSVSGKGPSSKYFHRTQIAQSSIIEEEEPEEESGRTDPLFDGQSTISADSVVVLTAQQRKDVIEKFSKALLRDLPIKCFASDNENVEMSSFHQPFSRSVKAYSKKVMANGERRSRQRQTAKAIRFLRNEIIHQCYKKLGGFRHSERRHIPSLVHRLGQHDISGKTAAEKVSEWNAHLLDLPGDVLSGPTSSILLSGVNGNDTNIPLAVGLHPDDKPASDVCNLSDTTEQSFSHISQLSQDEDSNISAEDQDVYTYLTEHSAFSELVDELRALVERHFCNQKELIHHRILLAIRRPGIIERFSDGIFRASFFIDWDVLDFLQTCYSLSQDLRHVIAVTGTPVNAQLATVEAYLQQTWPDHTWKLVDALNTAIASTIHGVEDEPPQISPQQIHISLEERKISVSGTEDLLVVVGQQLAWLGAACRDSAGQLAHCYTSFTDIKPTDPEVLELKFEIKYEVTPLDSGEPTSCWIDLVGDSVVVAGFPFAERDSSAIGLEVPLQIMGTIADIPLATLYRGGYVLKGRSMAFVPVKRGVDFVQWHLYNQSAGRISYQDINSMFPDRLLVKDLDESGLLSTRSFLGWCPESSNNLASGAYDYRAISYTKTPYLSKKVLSLTGASIGFQQFGTGSINFAIAKQNRMHRIEKAQYYKDLLDAAKQIPVVLQDMEDRRAWYADGERVILHVILHRHTLNPFKANGPVQLQSASPNDPASVRQAMMVNADILVSLDRDMERPGIQSKSFKDLVNELYTVLEGLMAETVDIAGIALPMDWKKHIQGWEYMDVVSRKLTPRLRETELKSTCGQWPELARDRNAVVLFGNRLQNVISPHPHPSPRLCRLFKELPKHKDYLAIESEKLENMYVESGAEDDRTQITPTGLQLHRSQHLFEVCPRATLKAERCRCERIQQLVPKRAKGKVKPIPKMNATGAVIIGQGNTSWVNELSHNWAALRGTFQHQSADSHSRAPDPAQSARGASVVDFYLPQPSNPSRVSGSESSSDSRSLAIITAAAKATTTTSDTSPARSSRFDRVSASNSTKSPAKTLGEINGMPSGEPSYPPNASSANTTSLKSKASPPGKHDRSSQLQPIAGQPEQGPQYNRMAQRPKYPRDNTLVVVQTNKGPHLPRQPVLKTLPENDRMDMPSMSTPRLRRKPNFPLEHPINVLPSA